MGGRGVDARGVGGRGVGGRGVGGEWIHQAALAIRAKVPLDVLRDQVAQFPTYPEAYLVALEKLTA